MDWFRMYSEFASDAKVQSMPEVMQRRLIMLLCLRCSNTLVTLQDDEIAFALRITDEDLAISKALFIRKGFIDDAWEIMNWEKRQFITDSSAARVAKHRAAKKQLSDAPELIDETQCNVTVSPQNRTDTEQIQNKTEHNKTDSEQIQNRIDAEDRHHAELKPIGDVERVFLRWQSVMKSGKSVLDKNRRTLIANALKIYSYEDICAAIEGCAKSPHHMGENAQNVVYNGLNLILRNAEKIDQFIKLNAGKARSQNESIAQINARITAEVLGKPFDDGKTIDMETGGKGCGNE